MSRHSAQVSPAGLLLSSGEMILSLVISDRPDNIENSWRPNQHRTATRDNRTLPAIHEVQQVVRPPSDRHASRAVGT